MTLIEAKVEAALCSRLSDRTYYIVSTKTMALTNGVTVKKGMDEDFLLTTTEDLQAVTWYKNGAEKGEGIHIKVTKWDEAQTRKNTKRSAKEIITDLENKPEKVKKERVPKSTEMSKLTFKTLEEASKSAETGLFEFKGKTWAVSVRGSWVLHKHIMEKINGGLVLVVREQGWYNYPKSMWNEFDGIFKSSSYDKGSYSQSVLPGKFAKYFTKFKK